MKKIMFSLFLLFTANPYFFAQVIYTDTSTGKKYLFIGGVYDNQLKLMNLQDKTITWQNKTILQQTDQLAPRTFLTKLFASGLVFHADGSTPYWQAIISENKL